MSYQWSLCKLYKKIWHNRTSGGHWLYQPRRIANPAGGRELPGRIRNPPGISPPEIRRNSEPPRKKHELAADEERKWTAPGATHLQRAVAASHHVLELTWWDVGPTPVSSASHLVFSDASPGCTRASSDKRWRTGAAGRSRHRFSSPADRDCGSHSPHPVAIVAPTRRY